MGKKKKSADQSTGRMPEIAPGAIAEAREFLLHIEWRRRSFSPDNTELTPRRQQLIQRIRKAFVGVSCHREVRVLLGAEAEDDYRSADAQAVLGLMEERDNWEAIPDDLLFACSCALNYVGPHAYRFLLARFLIGALQGVVDIYPGSAPSNDLEVYTRHQMAYLDEAQRTCLADYMSLECVEAGRTQRNQFLPWEHDEYRTDYAESMDYKEYGKLLIQRFLDREKSGC